MKKFYTTLALACAVGVSAFAAMPAAEKKAQTSFAELQSLSSDLTVARKGNKAPLKVATPIEDVEGFYALDYEYPLSGTKTNGTAKIEMVGDDEIILTFEPWSSGYSNISMDPLTASYNAETGVITITREDNTALGTYVDSQSGQSMTLNFDIEQVVPIPNDPEGRSQLVPIDVIEGVVNADGTIQFGDADTCMGFQVEDSGWVGLFRDLKLVAPDYFKFVASEWDSVGNALFTEDWLNRMLTGDDVQYRLQPREIPLYKNKADKNLYVVENPYKVEGWLNEVTDTEGYIVFSLEDPEFVPMRVLTPSGMWATLEEGGFPEEFYVYNQEGQLIYDREYDYDEAKYLFEDNDIAPSTYDEATKTVTLGNILFGYTSNPTATSYFPSCAAGTLKIKADGFGNAGVEGVINDAENAPKRFFNLQGMEVVNPAVGELVIVKQGNKTSKVIVK